MKVLVDATCARFSGIHTYAENLLRAWVTAFPDDDVHAVLPPGTRLELPPVVVRHETPPLRPVLVWRPLVQTVYLAVLSRRLRPDAVLALLPSTTLLRPSAPLGIVIYDFRHELRPEQFGQVRRLMRRVSYRRGYRLADGIIAISRRTLDDFRHLHPEHARVSATVVHLGADHVDTWTTDAAARTAHAVAFGHHGNKNLELSLESWRVLSQRGQSPPHLHVVGVAEPQASALRGRLATRGLGDLVTIHPFLPTADFRELFATAALIVFPSDFEGFGLPVIEALRLKVPIVVGPDPAVLEVSEGYAHVMEDWSVAAMVRAVDEATASTDAHRRAGRAHTERFSWRSCASVTRSFLLSLQRDGTVGRMDGTPPDAAGGRPDYLSGHLAGLREGLGYTATALALKVWNTVEPAMPTDRNAPILDIGPGGCELARYLCQTQGYTDVHVVDRSHEIVRTAQALGLPATLTNDTAAWLRRNPRRYDAIIMSHVLEHLPKQDIIPTLAALKEALSDEGALLVIVPNMGDPLNGLYYRYADFTHEVGFTEESLRYVLRQAGFTTHEFLDAARATRRATRLVQVAAQRALHGALYVINLPNGRQMRRRTGPELAVRAR